MEQLNCKTCNSPMTVVVGWFGEAKSDLSLIFKDKQLKPLKFTHSLETTESTVEAVCSNPECADFEKRVDLTEEEDNFILEKADSIMHNIEEKVKELMV